MVSSMARRSRKSSRGESRNGSVSRRAQVVWASLVGAMTAVGGLLFAIDSSPRGGVEGVTLTPLMATAGPDTVEVVFKTRAPLDSQRWQAIVIHDSGSSMATPASLESQARAMNLRGLGYHFVIGNGNGIDDGELHVGGRWLNQTPGAHAAGKDGDWYNRHSIGICLVGDGNRHRFTASQVRRLVQLVEALRREFNIPTDRVLLHSQIATTDSPGRFFPEATVRAQLRLDP
jgi:N-acetyl-anhydromuramyl-L-alanine amidase AmpD